jgi:two-component system OmpR family response regulator
MVLKVLCVDDDDSFRALFEFACQQQRDIRLTSAKTGEEALKHTAEDQFDLIVLDVVMPALDGPETLDRLRAQSINRDTPAVFMTAHAHPTELNWLRTMDVVDVLPKKFNLKQLAGTLRSLAQEGVAKRMPTRH